jgi:hypothetical protein
MGNLASSYPIQEQARHAAALSIDDDDGPEHECHSGGVLPRRRRGGNKSDCYEPCAGDKDNPTCKVLS